MKQYSHNHIKFVVHFSHVRIDGNRIRNAVQVWRDFPSTTGCHRLIISSLLLAQLAPMKTAPPPTLATNMTNVGRVENYIAPVWPRDVKPGEVPVFRVEQMHLACRLNWPSP